jgi:uncharacterized membrane protein
VTKEIEVAGTEKFVKTYFSKLQAMLAGPAGKTTVVKPKTAKASRKTKTGKKVTNIEKVITLIKRSKGGISTARLKEKTGLSERQIWSIVNRTSKEGKIRKVKRGVYGAVAASQE